MPNYPLRKYSNLFNKATNTMKTVSLLSIVLMACTFSVTNGFVAARPNSNSFKTKQSMKLNQQSNDNDNDESKASGTWNPLRLAVLKLKFTELKFTSPLNYEKRPGTYACANCDAELFDSRGKYDSGSGWPAFWKTAAADRIKYKQEWDGRIEVQCKNCKGHLGHVFPDGPMRMDLSKEDLSSIPSDDLKTSNEANEYTRLPRYCVNGASLKFKQK
jgi:peptide-methionine (R)-S-oxide reductase